MRIILLATIILSTVSASFAARKNILGTIEELRTGNHQTDWGDRVIVFVKPHNGGDIVRLFYQFDNSQRSKFQLSQLLTLYSTQKKASLVYDEKVINNNVMAYNEIAFKPVGRIFFITCKH